jgi:hypothetical protein
MENSSLFQFLNLRRLPFRLNVEQAAYLLGFAPHNIRTLVKHGLLVPLGKANQQHVKYFALVDLEEKGRDVRWLSKATAAIRDDREPDGESD